MCPPAAAFAVDVADQVRAGATPDALGAVTYAWGDATWLEPSVNCKALAQTFDFYAAQGNVTGNRPTIVYFHANGATSHVNALSPVYLNLVQPAVLAGFNVVSAEFRHPVTDQYLAPTNGGHVFHNDTGRVLQYLRAHAATFHISKNNLFTFGHSRGTLALWQALQPDLGGTVGPSSLPTAFFGYQAQTTYQCQQFSDLFLIDDADARQEVADCEATNWYWRQFGSAVDSVNAKSLPVHLQYRDGFVLEPGTTDQIRRLTYPTLLQEGFNTGHYPDYGIALLDRYEAFANPRMDYPEQYVSSADAFRGWQAFVYPKIVPDAP